MAHVIFPFAYVIVHADSVVGAVSGVHVTFEQGNLMSGAADKDRGRVLEKTPLSRG